MFVAKSTHVIFKLLFKCVYFSNNMSSCESSSPCTEFSPGSGEMTQKTALFHYKKHVVLRSHMP